MIHAFGENIQSRRIIIRRYVGNLQRAPLRVDIGPGQLRDLRDDLPAVIGKARAQIFFFSGRRAVRFPIERVDGQRARARGDHQRIRHILGLAVESDDHAGIVLSRRKAQMRVFLKFFPGDPPANRVACHQQAVELLIGKKVFEQTDTHIRPLRKPGQNNGAAIVIMLQIVRKRGPHILIGQREIRLAFFLRQSIDIQTRLPVIRGEEAAAFIIDPLFHIGSAQKAGLRLRILHIHVENAFPASVNSGTDEEDVHGLIRIFFNISPVFHLRVVGCRRFALHGQGDEQRQNQQQSGEFSRGPNNMREPRVENATP